ncbi:MAG: hypothetical protein HY906_23910 [Deltaproteobacteria bacterium]|nr:hypothetical protein [Deltaproteobacteria bacterium]
MYLTSHLVRTPAHDHGGVNTFIYTHRGSAPHDIDWRDPDATAGPAGTAAFRVDY